MKNRQCTKCSKVLPLSDFGRLSSSPDGTNPLCKKCASEYRRQYYEKHKTRLLALTAAYQTENQDRSRQWKRDYEARNKEKIRHAKRKYEADHPEVKRAHRKVHWAVKTGKLVRQPCELCGEERVTAHHDDYDKPLTVRWLCYKHHRLIHSSQGINNVNSTAPSGS